MTTHEGTAARKLEDNGAPSTEGPRVGVDRARQREEFGGFNWGAAFFGWLVAVGITALLTALLSAAGAAIGLTELGESEATSGADTISIIGAVLVILVLAIGYYAGGYVAGRMSRFDGGRQGLGVWLIGLVVTLVLAAAGALAGAEYNLLGQLNLPRIPVEEGSLAAGAAIALAIIVVVTVFAAMTGGKVGERYHRKVDRVGGVRPVT
jgi:MFS family permease